MSAALATEVASSADRLLACPAAGSVPCAPSLLPWLIVPVRSFASGKRRLSTALDGAARHRFGEALLGHVLGVAAAWPGLPRTLVVSPCDDALDAAAARGARALRQRGRGLNAALRAAASHVRGQEPGTALLVVSVDLPRLGPEDLLCLRGDGRHCRVATDRFGRGSNALFVPGDRAPHFAFGSGSRRRHERLAGAEAVRIDGLAFDVDTPEDLVLLGAWPT